jgi:hypothetical protein
MVDTITATFFTNGGKFMELSGNVYGKSLFLLDWGGYLRQ